MAYINVCKPYYAEYSATGNTVTYTGGKLMAYATSCNIDVNNSVEKLYGDGKVVATSGQYFVDGTLTLGLTSLPMGVLADITGCTLETQTQGGGKVIAFGGDRPAVYSGFGIVYEDVAADADTAVADGTKRWRAIVLPKVEFELPDDAVAQREDTISFQTPELTATIMRDDTADENWMFKGEFATVAAAEAYVKSKLGISA